jgi:hypothetical protein
MAARLLHHAHGALSPTFLIDWWSKAAQMDNKTASWDKWPRGVVRYPCEGRAVMRLGRLDRTNSDRRLVCPQIWNAAHGLAGVRGA